MLGIDIGSKSIKVIELTKSGEAWLLKSSGAVGYTGVSPDKAVNESDFTSIAEVLKKIIKQIGITTKDVNISLPEALAFTRVIKFPMLSDEEVSSAVKWEAEQYIPIPVNEAVVQYTILEKNQEKAFVSVLLVAAPKVVVEKYVKIIKLAGLIPVSAETELTALSRSLSPAKGVSLLVDLGSSATDMSIVNDSNTVFTRSIPVAGEAFTRAVSQGLGVEPIQAEEYKKTYGLDSNQLEGKVKKALEPIFRVIIDEIKKAVHFYQTDEGGIAPSSIIITGGASIMPGIVPYLTESLNIETIIGNPFGKVNIDAETLKQLAPYMSIYGTAVGLAMQENI
ncbi:MAG: Type IV pilus assembly protein PilM [uncultured bacterium]|nr:MAG: Type IV pilus assembly protein PilM [uncultured bacterium]